MGLSSRQFLTPCEQKDELAALFHFVSQIAFPGHSSALFGFVIAIETLAAREIRLCIGAIPAVNSYRVSQRKPIDLVYTPHRAEALAPLAQSSMP